MMRTHNRAWQAVATMASLVTSITRPASCRGRDSREGAAPSVRPRSKWRTAAVGASALAVTSTTFVAGTLPAAAQPTEFVCSDGVGYLTQGPTAPEADNLTIIDMASGEADENVDFLDTTVNAVGYNVLDDFIYGWHWGGTQEDGLYRIGANGETELIAPATDFPVFNGEEFPSVFAGDVDENGVWWGQKTTGDGAIIGIDVDPDSPTFGEFVTGTFTSDAGYPTNDGVGADWAYVPGGGDYLYQTFQDGDSTMLYRFNRSTLEYELVGDTGISDRQFGALYADAAGNLYGSDNNSGEIYRFNITTGEATLFSQGPAADGNDGAFCANALIPVDFGDAPDSYGTLLESNGPRHSLVNYDGASETAPVVLGSNVSIDDDGQPSGAADQDTFDDGVAEPINFSTVDPNQVEVTATNNSNEDALLAAWVDLDGSGTFDAGELIEQTVPAGSGTSTYTLDFPAASTTDNLTYMRLRLYADSTATPSPTGSATGGEVEDYQVALTTPDITLVKEADTNTLVAGETITYSFEVINSGDEELENVTISETAFDGSGTMSAIDPNNVATLAVGDSFTATATYTVTQADVDAGQINNSAEVVGTGTVSGVEVTDTDDEAVPANQDPDITLTKTADPLEYSAVGDVITYTFVAENTGNVTLTDVTISETSFDGAGSMSAIDTTPAQPATLAPGETLEGTATYTIEQADIDAGEINNTADVVGTPPEGENVTDTDDAVVTAVQDPALVFDKSATPTTDLQVGDEITYTFTAENTGNTTLTNVEIGETSFSGSGEMSALDCDPAQPATLAPGEVLTCTATYTLTQADIDAGSVTNAACATADGDISECDQEEIPQPEEPDIVLEKTPDPAEYDTVGQTITYTFEATNTGNVTLSDVEISETSFDGAGSMSAISGGTADALAPGETLTGTATYTIEQADIDAGVVNNSALAVGTSPQGTEVDDPADAQITAIQDPAIELVKEASPVLYDAVDQTITYTFTATNTGNVTLSDVVISETSFDGAGSMSALDCDPAQPATLAPGEVLSCTATYTIEQADIDAGAVNNTAEVVGTPPEGEDVTDEDDETVEALQVPELELEKTSDVQQVSEAGETITYTFEATNTGNTTLEDVTIAEAEFDGSGEMSEFTFDPAAPATLAPGETLTATATYEVTQEDIDNGSINNTACASATGGVGECDENTVIVEQNPAIELVKSSPDDELVVGETVTYNFVATNTGNVTLTDVTISEVSFDGAGEMTFDIDQPVTLAPGEQLVGTGSYVVEQADVDQGVINNVADVVGTDPDGEQVTDEDDEEVPGEQDPALELVKSSDPAEFDAVGDVITYSFEATNTGNVTLENVTIAEDSFSGTGDMSAFEFTPSAPATLAPGETLTATATYEVTQADLDAGILLNSACATADEDVESCDDHEVPGEQDPMLELEKSSDVEEFSEVGETITYTFEATNTGDITLDGVTIEESAFSGTGEMSAFDFTPEAPATLAPGETLTATATYEVTQADIDNGGVTNAACATADDGTEDCDEHEVPSVEEPDIVLEKSADPVEYDSVGQTIVYTFEATNAGNVTLNDVEISETDFDGAGSMSAISGGTADALAPGETLTGTATYTIEQADIDAGVVNNSALAVGTSPQGTEVDDPADAQITAIQNPAIELEKSANQMEELEVGETITYTFVATNTGNTTLEGVTIEETEFSGAGEMSEFTFDPEAPATLAPGEQLTATATYEIQQADVDAGTITNAACASATDGPEDCDDEEVPQPQDPALELTKSADVSEFGAVGDVITYTFAAENTGNVTLDDVTIEESEFSGAGEMSELTFDPEAPATLEPGDVLTATATYEIQQADIDNGGVTNAACAMGTPPAPQPEGDASAANLTGTSGFDLASSHEVEDCDESEVPSDPQPGLELVKTADQTDGLRAGDTITYSFEATNTGNVTLSNVEISESEFSGSGSMSDLDCDPAQPATLAPGEMLECTATYEVTEVDADAGHVHNEADVTGETPGGDPVDDGDSESVGVSEEPKPEPSPLPKTGASVMGMGALGLVLVAGGALLLARRRKEGSDVDDELV